MKATLTREFYIPTKEKTKAIKDALKKVYGASWVRVVKGTGTASHWITTDVTISERPADCSCAIKSRWADCPACKAAVRTRHEDVERIAHEALKALGADFGHYYSDDYSDSTPHECHLINIHMFARD